MADEGSGVEQQQWRPSIARRPRIVVVGSYAVGLVMRTSQIPGRGETVLGHEFQAMDGGKGSNQAVACARLGADTTFVAAIGDDAHGAGALALLAAEGVDTTHLRRVPGTPTGVGFILVDAQGDNAIAVDLGANRLLSRADIDRAEAAIATADIVLTQLEIEADTALYALAVARRHGVRTILNPAPAQPLADVAGLAPTTRQTTANARDLAVVDILTPNLSEARTLTGLHGGEVADLAQALRGSGIGTVVLTVGEQGAWIVDVGSPLGVPRRVPAPQVTALDTTGAGDAFSAALAVALAEGATLDLAVPFGCAAGAFCVRAAGTIPSYATRAQLTSFIKHT